jgi:hypothetical protein
MLSQGEQNIARIVVKINETQQGKGLQPIV